MFMLWYYGIHKYVLANLYYVLKIIFLPLHMTSVYLFLIWGCCGSRTFRGYMQSCKRVTFTINTNLSRIQIWVFSSHFAFFKNLLRELFIIALHVRMFIRIGYVIVVTFWTREKAIHRNIFKNCIHSPFVHKHFKGNEIDIYWYIKCYWFHWIEFLCNTLYAVTNLKKNTIK